MYELYPKTFEFEKNTGDLLRAGAKICADVVGSTMGPGGRLVMYEESHKSIFPATTKDGVSVAQMIRFADQKKDLAAQFVIQAAMNQVRETGDGTTLTTILIDKILEQCYSLISAGIPVNKVVSNISDLLYQAIDIIKKNSKAIESKKELDWIATVSSNNDKKLGELISEAVWRTGEHGLVEHVPSSDGKHRVEYQDGYILETGITAREFVTNTSNNTYRVNNPYLLLCSKDIYYINDFVKLIDKVINHHNNCFPESGIPTLILVAPQASQEVMNGFITNMGNPDRSINLLWIKPSKMVSGDRLEYVYRDLAAISGATYINSNTGIKVQDLDLKHIGTVDFLSQTPLQTLLTGFKKDSTKTRIEQLKDLLNHDIDALTKQYAEESIARLQGGVATIFCGGVTDTEIKEVMDRVDDAKKACKSALEQGYSSGGGVEFLKTIGQLEVEDKLFEKQIRNILSSPAKRILQNAGREDWQRIIDEIITNGKAKGYDINGNKFIDMRKHGVVDPSKVLTHAIKNSLSSAVSMLKTAVMITHDFEGIKKLKEFESYGN